MATILVVEDSNENAQLVITAMQSRGYDVVWVKDGESAIQAAREILPDLILMDLRLPRLNGWEATRSIRGDRRTKHIPIFAISVEAKGDDRQRAFDAGCDLYFPKPFSVSDLRGAVAEYIGPP